MSKSKRSIGILVLSGLSAASSLAQDADIQLGVEHAECIYFGAQHQKYAFTGLKAPARPEYELSALTSRVTRKLGIASATPVSDAAVSQATTQPATIDKYLFAAMSEAGVAPAANSNDYEFIRRVTLDLTGRIPVPARVLAFAADTSPDKRAKLIDELLAKPEWVDKWTMYFGDLYKNCIRNTQVNRYEDGRNAFYRWIHDSLAAAKPYDQMARELIAAQATNTWEQSQGQANWLVGGLVTGGPVQDIFDQQASNTAQTFLGLSNVNCVLCHNGRGHLDGLNLWASRVSRYQAWQFSAFFSRTFMNRVRPDPKVNANYWTVETNTRYRTDYALNTTTGNRPARAPVGTERVVAPAYWNGKAPAAGDDYRVFLSRTLTADLQFARATVNYMWKQFFNRGLVEPVDQFDLARLDPDNPPPAPWTLQPSNARLLNGLAQDFIDSKYDLKTLTRQIANSRAYQLSARYNGEWKPLWEPLFARKLVRRLWAEEIHDALAQSSNVIPSYTVGKLGRMSLAMQFPEPRGVPGGAVGQFLDNFLRGDRDSAERSEDGSVLEALSLKNDTFVMSRIRSSTTGGVKSLLADNIDQPNDQLVRNLYLAVLSRLPGNDERNTALLELQNAPNRAQAAENLLWTLYNKIDFIFNY